MGATTFINRAKGTTMVEAFNAAVADAQWEYGHGGYSGTIAEKAGEGVIDLTSKVDPTGQLDAKARIEKVQNDEWLDDGPGPLWAPVDDKWGPAGGCDLGDGTFLLWGWASE